MWTGLNEQLYDALKTDPPRYALAEDLIRAGADINAIDEDGDSGLLSDLLMNNHNATAAGADGIVDFAVAHGLDPSKHGGMHLLLALMAFCDAYENSNTKYLEVFKKLLIFSREAVLADKDNFLDENIDEEMFYHLNDFLRPVGAFCALLKLTVQKFKAGQLISEIRCWDQAKGLKIEDIRLMFTSNDPSSPLFFEKTVNGRILRHCHEGSIGFLCGEDALTLCWGGCPVILPADDPADDYVATFSIGNRFASVIGRTIQQCQFLKYDYGDHEICTIGLDLDDNRSLKIVRRNVDGKLFNRMEIRNHPIRDYEIDCD